MGLCDLPNDVLFLVARQACANPDKEPKVLARKKLPLLAVCRRLRGISLPVVYDTVYIVVWNRDMNGHHTGVYIRSNLDLVLSVGCLHLVRRVDIDFGLWTNLLRELDSTVRWVRATREQWDSVRTLRVDMHESPPTRRRGLDAFALSAQEAAAALAAAFPRVQRLDFSCTMPTRAIDKFAGCVAAQYADQLRALNSDCVIATPPKAVLRVLRCANIRRGDWSSRLPRIDPAELRSLKLEHWRGDHSWTGFSADGDESQDIWFPNLRVLELCCYWGTTARWTGEAKRKGRLHFPALRVLKVTCEDGVPHGFRRGVFLTRVDRVVVVAKTGPMILEALNMALPSARHFQLLIEHHQGSISPDAAAAAKRMLDNARDCDGVELKIGPSNLRWQPSTIASAALTRLKVLPTINMATMMEFIQCLPRLSSLYIRDMDAHQIQPGLVVVPEPGADWLVKPISSSLKYICIKFNCFVQLPEPAVTALRYLLLVVSSLSAVSVYGIPGDPIDDFVDAYADQYPHLARLRISVGRHWR